MKIFYYRCSTDEQNPERQIKMAEEEGCERVFSDMLSGKDRNRPGLDELLRFARSGDVVITESISRISRSTRDFLNIMDELTSKGVAFVSKKEAIDTTTPQGKFMLTVFAALSELERSQILQRQAEGIAIAKQKGVYKGRIPKKIDMYLFERLYKEWKEGKIKQRYIMEKLNISRSKLYELIRSYEANSNDE
jgi:DNA invertase Pin-like site-specific DNA recombinase